MQVDALFSQGISLPGPYLVTLASVPSDLPDIFYDDSTMIEVEKNVKEWETKFANRMAEVSNQDTAHDMLHFQRVVNTAKQLCAEQGADANVVIPAAWLHDVVNIPKDDPLRSQASLLSANAAIEYLESVGYPEQFYPDIAHAIESHSYSANVSPLTLEARIVQDADRLDALGAIGIARWFAVGGMLNRQIYCADDPFCEEREPADDLYTVDHFYIKLVSLPDSMQTASGRAEGKRRIAVMRGFLQNLAIDITPS